MYICKRFILILSLKEDCFWRVRFDSLNENGTRTESERGKMSIALFNVSISC